MKDLVELILKLKKLGYQSWPLVKYTKSFIDSAFLMKEFSIKNFNKAVEEIVNNYDLYVRKSFINSERFSYKKFDKKLNNIVSEFL